MERNISDLNEHGFVHFYHVKSKDSPHHFQKLKNDNKLIRARVNQGAVINATISSKRISFIKNNNKDNNSNNVNPADNKCGTGSLNTGSGRPIKPGASFNPSVPFGHLHSGAVEWWVIQVGQTTGRFENIGEFHATEGDVMYVPPNTWHETNADTPSGPSVRLAMGSYQRISMEHTEPAQ